MEYQWWEWVLGAALWGLLFLAVLGLLWLGVWALS